MCSVCLAKTRGTRRPPTPLKFPDRFRLVAETSDLVFILATHLVLD